MRNFADHPLRSQSSSRLHIIVLAYLAMATAVLGFSPSDAAGTGLGAVHTVCPISCDFTSIDMAVSAADPGDTVRILAPFPHTENNILVGKSIHFEGLGMNTTIVQGAVSSGSTPEAVFEVSTSGEVTFSDMTIRHGGYSSSDPGGGIVIDAGIVTFNKVRISENQARHSAGIHNEGITTLNDSLVIDNLASDIGGGGGITNENILIINNSQVSDNFAGWGGGINNFGNLIVRDSSINGNTTVENGGGISTFGGSVDLFGTTIHGNSTDAITDNLGGGGLLACWPEVNLTNSTISGNETVGNGGGIAVCDVGEVNLANVTISDNTADLDDSDGGDGGGIFVDPAGSLHMKNTLVAENHDLSNFFLFRAPDCDGLVDSDAYNLIGDLGQAVSGTHCSVAGDPTGNQIGVLAGLGALQDNGGSTWTHALMTESPAVNAGNPSGCTDFLDEPIPVDQRGGDRPDRCDIGAFELNALTAHLWLPAIIKP